MKINVINTETLKTFIKKEIKDVLSENKPPAKKPRAPRRGSLRYLEWTQKEIEVIIDGWQYMKDDVLIEIHPEYKASKGIEAALDKMPANVMPPMDRPVIVQPDSELALVIKNVYINSRKKSRVRSIRKGRNGFGIWAPRSLKSRSLRRNVNNGKRIGTDLVVYNYTERWDGAENFRGGNKSWKRWVVDLRFQINPPKRSMKDTHVCVIDIGMFEIEAEDGIIQIPTIWIEKSALENVEQDGEWTVSTSDKLLIKKAVDASANHKITADPKSSRCDALPFKVGNIKQHAKYNTVLCAENPGCLEVAQCRRAKEILGDEYDIMLNALRKNFGFPGEEK